MTWDEDSFNTYSNEAVNRMLSFLKVRYSFENYNDYKGTFLIMYPEELTMLRDRLHVYCRMFNLPHAYEDKERWFISSVNHLVLTLLKSHPVRWCHLGSFRCDLVSYRKELESILHYNHKLKILLVENKGESIKR